MNVKLIDLTKEFVKQGKKKGSGDNVIAVNHINIDIPNGKLIGLLGPSGCGKSTTLYMIAGLHRPTTGQIFFGEKEVTELPPEKRGIGLVFQNYALYPHLSVAENIMFPLISRKEPKTIAYQKALEMAKLVGIDGLMNRKPKELSGGQQQRVAIARALVKMPEVLLLDEPLSNLDARLRLQTREEIKRIQRTTGITTIFVTHDQEEAMSISDEIVVMNFGVIQQIGAPQDVYDNPANEFVAKFLGTPPINIVKAVYEDSKIKFGNQILDEEIDLIDLENGEEVHIGIRPEFFSVCEDGKYQMDVEFVEYIGRDKTIIFNLPEIDGTFKAVIPSSILVEPEKSYKFSLNRFFLFDKEGRRIK